VSLPAASSGAGGDFGRPHRFFVFEFDGIHDWIGPEAAARFGQPASTYPLTESERQLRDLAYPLIEPPYDRNKWYSILGEYGITRVFLPSWWGFDRTAYAARLFGRPVRSADARYARLNDDIRNDVERIGPFFAAAGQVLDLDRKREQSMTYIPDLSPAERANALCRVNENKLIVAWVYRSLTERAASYRFALERLVVATPSPLAAGADRSLTLLQARIAEMRPQAPVLAW
jgi:hypothetical protein